MAQQKPNESFREENSWKKMMMMPRCCIKASSLTMIHNSREHRAIVLWQQTDVDLHETLCRCICSAWTSFYIYNTSGFWIRASNFSCARSQSLIQLHEIAKINARKIITILRSQKKKPVLSNNSTVTSWSTSCWIRCRMSFALIRSSVILCIRGSRSRQSKPVHKGVDTCVAESRLSIVPQ